MDFQTAVRTCLHQKYIDFNGRASRSEYWWFILFCIVLGAVATAIDSLLFPRSDYSPVNTIVGFGVLLPGIAVLSRRLHDRNWSGWWQLLNLTIIGGIIILVLTILQGDDGPNRYGPPPV